ncbi:MAG TPA: hypothetical protein PKE26_15900 [Kiritimatiellia bacterium]|nr:hypothetical protein [Kiritimatiellia bacterium]HMP00580.1 hypothetical protein [Kiritimatiellia bacterium]
MTVNYQLIASKLNAGKVTTAMLDEVIADYRVREFGTMRGDILVYLLVIMERLVRSMNQTYSFAWFQSNIEPPTHYNRADELNWDLIYKFSDENIGMVDIRNGYFTGFGRLCCTKDTDNFWSELKEWKPELAWKQENA